MKPSIESSPEKTGRNHRNTTATYSSYTFRILGTFANQQLILTIDAPLGSFATTQWH